jgi:hypothetical protein
VTFADVLRELVLNTDGAIAAIFLDQEGEAVQVIGEDFLRDELKVIGAYQGIFVAEARKICSEMNHGRLQRLKVDWRGSTMLNRLLPDGYYLVIVLCSGSSEAMAWEELERCSEKLRRELA